MRWNSISKALFFIFSLACLLGQTVTVPVYGVDGNEEDPSEIGPIFVLDYGYEGPPGHFRPVRCEKGFITGIRVVAALKLLAPCLGCATGSIVPTKVYCSDGSEKSFEGVQDYTDAEIKKLPPYIKVHDLKCPSEFPIVSGLEGLTTKPEIVEDEITKYYAGFFSLRLFCQSRNPVRSEIVHTDSAGPDFGWGVTFYNKAEDYQPNWYPWQNMMHLQRKTCPYGHGLKELFAYINFDGEYYDIFFPGFSGGYCTPHKMDPFSEENMEKMRRDAAEQAARDLPLSVLDFEGDGSNDEGAEEGSDNGEDEPGAKEPAEEEAEAESEAEPCPPGYERNASGICRPSSREHSEESGGSEGGEEAADSDSCPDGYERNARGVCRPLPREHSEEEAGEEEVPPAQGSMILPLATTAAAGAAWGWYGCSLQAGAMNPFSILSLSFIFLPALLLLIWRFRKRLFTRFY